MGKVGKKIFLITCYENTIVNRTNPYLDTQDRAGTSYQCTWGSPLYICCII